MHKPFTREAISARTVEVLHKGQWANADALRYHDRGKYWVIKDFSTCPWIIRNTVGRLLVSRELLVLRKLQGIGGVTEDVFRLDGFALCYLYIPGKTLTETCQHANTIDSGFFLKLERLVKEIHAHNIVHLDTRNAKNILIRDGGSPGLLDFQSGICLERVPRFLHTFLKKIDMSGVYKHWSLVSPESLDEKRRSVLNEVNKRRRLWFLKGYPFQRTWRRFIKSK